MLDTLSPEILHHICRQFDGALDVSRFRLTCKFFAEVGLRSLLPRITLVTLPKAYQHLSDVANHPVLRHHVEEILLITNKLPLYRDMNDFAHHVPPPGMLDWPVNPTEPHATAADHVAYERHQWPDGKLEKIWIYYKELCEQQENQEKSDGLAVVREVIAKLPKLRSVHIRSFTAEGGPTPFLWPGSEYSKLAVNFLGDMPNIFYPTASLLEGILSATLAAKAPLEELFVTDLDAKFFQCEDSSFDEIRLSLEQLRRISLQLEVEDDEDSWDDCRHILGKEKGGLQQILHSSTQLVSIEIITPDYAIGEYIGSFPILFNDMVWSRLSRLHLANFVTTSEALVTFLEAHANSLKVLQMRNFKLSGQHVHNWHQFFVSVASFLRLEDANFTGHFTADHFDVAGNDYIDMGDDIKEVPMTVGDVLRALLCRSYSEAERDMYNETFDDLLKCEKKRLAEGFRMEVPVRHPQFLRDMQP